MDCTFTGRTLILSKATKASRDDAEQLREVMKISGHIELPAFAKMMGCAQTEISNWWHHDDDGSPRFQHMDTFAMVNAYRDHYADIDGTEFEGVHLEKFKAKLKRNRRVYLEFEMTVNNPDALQQEQLHEAMKHGISDFSIRSDQSDLVEDAA